MSEKSSKPRYVIVAGEASGDILGANLIESLRKRCPDALFEGIGGPLMEAQGFQSLVPMDRLSVMGLVEVLGRLPELLKIRKHVYTNCLDNPPLAFIGIDSPDFTLPLERKLKDKGILAVHYVSPSVWAWRQKRIFKIKKSVDLMLALFPFEMPIYQQHGIPVVCVGHTLADDIPLMCDRAVARAQLNMGESNAPVFAILPGSRRGEVERLAPLFIASMSEILRQQSDVRFIIPAVNDDRREQITELLNAANVDAIVVNGQSRDVMIAADAILLASGTAALEGMLVKRPMVVAYRFTKLTYAIMSRMIKVPYVSLPNLLANKALVPELIQDKATPKNLASTLLRTWKAFEADQEIQQTYLDLHLMLRKQAGDTAAEAIVNLVEKTHMRKGN
ncbi:lipid-A-disaccharide synthase [Marinomonas sp. 15G1-11]|uniref:Lipid-A-disaccharide synthase n=1 Tax=Marinomonas phaeophyticola TaxID=3004091 RepID=A0ABT4JVA5_9GAMM|nr:lipid-A-disaccharide synthase [Marinomonas sp. 15G1-11]MCZ2721713.1 lipid-A-disaccharide synthase [Marinomonas sp. 15G1-11]